MGFVEYVFHSNGISMLECVLNSITSQHSNGISLLECVLNSITSQHARTCHAGRFRSNLRTCRLVRFPGRGEGLLVSGLRR